MNIPLCLLSILLGIQSAGGSDNTIWTGGMGVLSEEQRVWDVATLEWDISTNEFRGRLRTANRIYRVTGSREGAAVSLILNRRNEDRQFKGAITNQVLDAKAEDNQPPNRIILRRVDLIPESKIAELIGVYALNDDQRIAFRATQNGLVMTNYGNGQIRNLYASSPDRYVAGPAIAIPDPIKYQIQFLRHERGHIDRVQLMGDDGLTTVATRRPAPVVEDFEYSSFDGTTIRGSLYLPAGDGPHPAIVWVHGSGRVTRENAGSWPLYFADLGFAMLAVDKRGVGKSEGNYQLPDGGGRDNFPHMRRRSRDVAAAVKALGQRNDIDAQRIGLVGGSQAGWVIPMTIHHTDAEFAIILSGGATPLSIEGRFSRLASENSSGADMRPVDELIEELRAYNPPDEGIDTELSQMDYPCLWLYGLKDRSNPSRLCAELIQRIAAQHQRDFTVKLFPDGNHSLLVCQFGGSAEAPSLDRLVPGMHRTIENWLEQKGLLPHSKSR